MHILGTLALTSANRGQGNFQPVPAPQAKPGSMSRPEETIFTRTAGPGLHPVKATANFPDSHVRIAH
jgi:hypothetical protein